MMRLQHKCRFLEKLLQKLVTALFFKFLLRCPDKDVIASFVRVTHHIITRSSNIILRKISQVVLRERIENTRRTAHLHSWNFLAFLKPRILIF